MSQPLRVLVVEDSEDDVTLLLHTLRRGGYSVTSSVVDTPEGMRSALLNSAWDVITSDHAMPRFSAPEALALAKELCPEVPFLIVSGEIDLNLGVSLMRGGARDYIQKRELPRLTPAIERVLREVELDQKRARSEAALREQENWHRTILRTAMDGFWLVDVDGRLLEVNETYAHMSGYSVAELLTMRITDLEYRETGAQVDLHMQKIVSQSHQDRFETQHRRKDGSVFHVEVSVQYREIEGGRLVAFLRDITERKRKDGEREALLEIMQGLSLTKDLPDLLALVHRSVAKVIFAENFFVVFYNKDTGLFEEVYSVDQYDPPAPPSRLEKSITAYVYHADRPLIVTQALFDELRERGEVELVGTNSASWLGAPLNTPDGTIGVIVVQDYETPERYTEGDRDFLSSIGSQVALAIERKRAEEALRESQELFNLFLRNSPVYCFIKEVNPSRSLTLYVSDNYIDMIGIPASEMIGRSMEELFPPEFAAKITADDWTAASKGEVLRVDEELNGRSYTTIKYPIIQGGRTLLAGYTIDITERKQAEAVLSASESRFRAILQNVSTVAVQGYTSDGTTLYWNAASERIYGYSAEEAIGRSLFDLIIPAEMNGEVRLAVQQMVETGQPIPPTELLLQRKDGSRAAVYSSHVIVPNAGQQPELFCLDIDLTEMNQTVGELRESQALVHAIFDSTTDLIWSVDPENFTLLTYNSAVKDFYLHQRGIKLVPGMRLEDQIQRDDIVQLWRGFYQRALKEGSYTIEYQVYAGAQIYLETFCPLVRDGKVFAIAVFGKDITEFRRVEMELRQANERLEFAQNAAGVGIWDWEMATDELTWSAQYFYIHGLDPAVDKATFDTWRSVLYPADFEITAARINEAIQTHQPLSVEYRIRTRGDEPRWIHVLGSTTYANTGEASRMSGICIDFTARKQAEEELFLLNAELEQRVAERTRQLTAANQELEAFSYSVSHDLRAPLRALTGLSSLLMEEYAEKFDDQGRHYLDRIQAASRRMDHLVNDLMNLSGLARVDLVIRKVDLSSLAKQIAEDLRTQDPARRVTFEIADDLVVLGDENLFRIALENLLNNAFKFTGQREQAVIQVGSVVQDGKPVFFVRDNGAGFDMESAGKLFTPFQRLHSETEFPGTGIGLAIVQRILHRHGGRIWAQGEVGQGAAVYFALA